MSVLTRPYEITVWEDVLINGVLTEQKLGIVGSDKMEAQCRALDPTLTRNVNGTKKLTFNMYKHYVDNMTGEKVENPFCDWLVSERKVKLEYDGKWYDFIIKDINENSSNYLYTYSLEDALVQELSKNGFGVTLDAELMNNIGDAQELGEYVLAETDWDVESEVFVQTVDESLVYLKLPADLSNFNIYHLTDQVAPYTSGVEERLLSNNEKDVLASKTILAFYSSCKNKPNRFQFIYANGGDYGKNPDGTYKIARKDDRAIIEKDCQYYIEFDNPQEDYIEDFDEAQNADIIRDLDLLLPPGFTDGETGKMYDSEDETGTLKDEDSKLSSWYRGKRYGFAQQSQYIPLLERYCQKFERQEKIPLIWGSNTTEHKLIGSEPGIVVTPSLNGDSEVNFLTIEKDSEYTGIKLSLQYHPVDQYVLKYRITKLGGDLTRIGGHNHAYYPESYNIFDQNGNSVNFSKPEKNDSYVIVDDTSLNEQNSYWDVEIIYTQRDTNKSDKNLYIQPNRGQTTFVSCKISNLSLTMVGDYFGYTESEFISPTVIQNRITSYNFESTSGWTAADSQSASSAERAGVENVYGRFDSGEFISILDDFYSGDYEEENVYLPYMKMTFKRSSQFVLNSGIKDNRTMIGNLAEGEEWVLDYKIVNSNGGSSSSSNFNFDLDEYAYDTISGTYRPIVASTLTFTKGTDTQISGGYHRIIFTVSNSDYTKETFKKNSAIYLKISPTGTIGDAGAEYYIEKIALYRKSLDEDGNIIVPDYENEESLSAQEFVKTGVIEHKYHYFSPWLLNPENPDAITEKDSLPTIVRNSLDYIDYKPVYNEGAKKVRSVTAKESNYFNILQSIAETFECWVDLEVTRDNFGGITSKKIKFKNYIGQDSYASFRYGVNLKDIQRTFSSKNITTKLIVKQNNNENAEGGFCTIQRAGANPTGENYIYDFQYYQNQGIMDADDFSDTVYSLEGAKGPDAEIWKDTSKVEFPKEPDAKTNSPTRVNSNVVIYESDKITVTPGDLLLVSYGIRSFENELEGTVLPALHQFFTKEGETYERKTYCWADYDKFDTTPPTTSNAYKYVNRNRKYYISTIVVPKEVTHYAFGLRNTQENGSFTGTLIHSSCKIYNVTNWENTDNNYTLKGYYPRIKKINEAILPINEEIIGLQADLVKKKAALEVAEATYEASVEGIAQTREDFVTLTGLYPEEVQIGDIQSINGPSDESGKNTIEKQEDWWTFSSAEISTINKTVTVNIELEEYYQEAHFKPQDFFADMEELTGDAYRIYHNKSNSGILVKEEWEVGRKYKLEYDIKATSGTLYNIGCHAHFFSQRLDDTGNDEKDFSITVTNQSGVIVGKVDKDSNTNGDLTICNPLSTVGGNFADNTLYHVVIEGTYCESTSPWEKDIYIQPNRGLSNTDDQGGGWVVCEVSNLKLSELITGDELKKGYDRTAHYYLNVTVNVQEGINNSKSVQRTYDVSCKIPANASSATSVTEISAVDMERSDVQKYLTEYTKFYEKRESSLADKNRYSPEVAALEQSIELLSNRRKMLLEYKTTLNRLFFKKYSRFILEGTWISEEYVDDDKYYADAQSVLYNSCYPQVAYNINVLSLKGLPGYEMFDFGLGDKTNVIDPQFFGSDYQEEVIITETAENLDDPSKSSIKVQNFKNQFQDLFQKITATVQQAQYNTGSYEKGAKLVEADVATKGEFIANAINSASEFLEFGQTVTTGGDGITITDKSNKRNSLKLVGGAILFSVEKPDTQDNTWMTGITKDGISANLITAGQLDTGMIQIMSGNVPVFKWDTYGISAYSADWNNKTISNIDSTKFVRFDQFGIYGIDHIKDDNNNIIDGKSWTPSNNAEIDEKATFALTWEGLKVTQPLSGDKKATARIGNYTDENGNKSIIKINNGEKNTFLVDGNGNTTLSGKISMVSENRQINMDTDADEIFKIVVSNSNVFSVNQAGNIKVNSLSFNEKNERTPHIGANYTSLTSQNYIRYFEKKYDKNVKDYVYVEKEVESNLRFTLTETPFYQGSASEGTIDFASIPLRFCIGDHDSYIKDIFCIGRDSGIKGRSLSLIGYKDLDYWTGEVITDGKDAYETDERGLQGLYFIPQTYEEFEEDEKNGLVHKVQYSGEDSWEFARPNSTIILKDCIILVDPMEDHGPTYATKISKKGITYLECYTSNGWVYEYPTPPGS